MQEILDQYGYLALAIGTFLEGETAILVASSMIREGIFEGPYTVLFGFAGSFVSDWLYYLIGRINGTYFISRRPKLQSRFEPMKRFFDRYRLQVLLTYRFLYGFRVIIPLLIGMSGVKPGQYLVFTVISGLVWATVVSTLGYSLGVIFELNTQSFRDNILLIMIALGCFGLTLGWSVNKFVTRKMSSEN